MTRDEGKRKVRNAFDRIRVSIITSRLSQPMINRLVERIDDECAIAIEAFRDSCQCGDPGPTRTVDMKICSTCGHAQTEHHANTGHCSCGMIIDMMGCECSEFKGED